MNALRVEIQSLREKWRDQPAGLFYDELSDLLFKAGKITAAMNLMESSFHALGAEALVENPDASGEGAEGAWWFLTGGGHTLEVAAPGYKAMRDELVVTAGTARTVKVELEKPVVVKNDRFYSKWYFWAPVGVIVAGAAIGITYAVTTSEDPIKGTLSPGLGSID